MLQIRVDKDGYWTGEYATIGGFLDGIEVKALPEHYEQKYVACYKLTDGVLVFDEAKKKLIDDNQAKVDAELAKTAKLVELAQTYEPKLAALKALLMEAVLNSDDTQTANIRTQYIALQVEYKTAQEGVV